MKHIPLDQTRVSVAALPDRPLIVHVVRQFWPNKGGLEDVVLNLCRQSLKAGYRVRVVTLNSRFSARETTLPTHEWFDGIEIVRVGWKGSNRYPLAPGVLKHIGDAQVVHVHAIDFFFDFLALTHFLHRKPMIATTHGGFFHTRKFAAIKSVWFKTLTRFSASRYKFLVACSRSDQENFEQIARKNLRVIENGADTIKFDNRAAQEPQKRLITIGRFSSNKRLDRLIDTMAALVSTDPEWTLDIVGVDSDLSKVDIEKLIDDADLSDKITLSCNLDNQGIAGRIARASFFVSASEYEGFGLVAIEALSAGLIPVVHHNPAYQMLAERHDVIALADFCDPQAATEKILESWKSLSQPSPSTLRTKAIAAAAHYSWDRVAQSYFDLYATASRMIS